MTSTDGDHDFRFCAIMCARLPLFQVKLARLPFLGAVLSRRKRSSSTPDKSTPRTCCRAVRRATSSDFKCEFPPNRDRHFLLSAQKSRTKNTG
jgi:hypothetical protein